jgi:serine/threonine-protein kinase
VTRAIVALKILADMPDGQSLERFRREHEILRTLDHPNIVRVLGPVEEHSGRHYFATEYVPGSDLSKVLQQAGRLEPGRAFKIVRQVLQGLAYAHGRGVVHRDIKLGNILVDSSFTAKLGDFGIARLADTTRLTQEGVILGTPHYMAPEIWAGGTSTPRSDLYSVGIVLFELLTGRAPFDGANYRDLMRAATSAPLPPASLGESVERFLRQATEKNPARRFESAYGMLAASAGLEHTAPNRDRKSVESSKARHDRSPSRRFRWIAAAGLVPLAILVPLLWSAEQPPVSPPAPLSISVWLRDGRTLNGVFVRFAPEMLVLRCSGRTTFVPLHQVRVIEFGQEPKISIPDPPQRPFYPSRGPT